MGELVIYTYDGNRLHKHSTHEYTNNYSLNVWNWKNGIFYINSEHKELHTLCNWNKERLGKSNYYIISNHTFSILLKLSKGKPILATKNEIALCHAIIETAVEKTNYEKEKYAQIFFFGGINAVLDSIYTKIYSIDKTYLIPS